MEKRLEYTPKKVRKMALQYMRKELSQSDIEQMNMPEDACKALYLNIEAYQYMLQYEDAGNRYITERLRTAYVGEEFTGKDGAKVISMIRGTPTGTIVAIPNFETGQILIGVSKIKKTEKYVSPLVGLYLALRNARVYHDGLYPEFLNTREKRQMDRFRLRAKAYFFPEKYSFTRGTDPISYPKYEEIHKRQVMILGEEKVKSNSVLPPAKDAKNKGRKVVI